MKRLFIAFLLLLFASLGASLALAQNPVVTRPQGVTVGNYSGTLAATNTFQSVLASSTAITGRIGCIIQNTGTNAMYIYPGVLADATTAKSFKITAGQVFYCNNAGVV